MCWIFWYHGKEGDVASLLLHGLQKLEYRGYDSAGIFIGNSLWETSLWRAAGKVANLAGKIWKLQASSFKLQAETLENNQINSYYTYGIAHTRWATHGGVSEKNCHPHMSNNGKISLVHNGIIENYMKIKKELIQKWYTFSSETDTEVIANLLQDMWTGDLTATVELATKKLRGAYALLIVHVDFPELMVGVKLGSPLLVAYNTDGDFYFSSDAQALTSYVDKLMYLEEGDVITIKNKDFLITSGGVPMIRDVEDLDQKSLEASKGSYKHFMLKEMYEQAAIVKRIYKGRVDFDGYRLTAEAFHGMKDEHYRRMVFVASGTSSYVAQLASLWMEYLVGMETKVEIGSEYENKPLQIRDDTLHIFVSQSGETADSLTVLKLIKERGGKTCGIVNVPGSMIARLTDSGLYTRAGTEIGVAATKAVTAQAVSLLILALFLWKKRWMRYATYKNIMKWLETLPMLIETVLEQSDYIRSIAEQLKDYRHMFFLWRQYQLPIAYEASLKIKETSYIHSEAYGAGELKHGPLALVDEDFPSVLLMPHDEMFEKNLSTLQEIKARSGKVLVISDKKVNEANRQIMIPASIPEIYPFLTNIVGQLLAYHVADLLGRDIDKPRNLAKSVTVK